MNEQAVKAGVMKAILCCRAASGDREAIQRQEKMLSEYATDRDYTVTETFIGYGAMDSMIYHSLRLRAKYHEFDILLIAGLDVLGNGAIEITHEIDFLNRNGVKVLSLQEGELNSETLPQIFRSKFKLVER